MCSLLYYSYAMGILCSVLLCPAVDSSGGMV